ncbi:hypothetical protein ACP275_12G047100 [Erythranthe tilingii]
MASPSSEVAKTIVLIGKIGNGKSSTGNSVLRRRAFKSMSSSTRVTNTCELHTTTLLENGQNLAVVDTPGLFDCSAEPQFIGKEIAKCINLAKDGIHAILLVASIKTRISKEEEEAGVLMLQAFFGPKIIDYMVVVFTGGDDLEDDETLDDYFGRNCPQHYKYILETTAYPREHEQLKELRMATVNKYQWCWSFHWLLTTALALPDDGKIIAIDPDREAYETGLPFIQKANVAHKIHFIQSDAFKVMEELKANGEEGTFDFAFVDADKQNYIRYHEQLLKLVKVGGIIAYDNTLWSGTVAASDDDEMEEYLRKVRVDIMRLNTFLAADQRIELAQLSIGDGLTLCRRVK